MDLGRWTGVSELLLVRHGESQGNTAAAEANRARAEAIEVPARDPDVELSSLGREQAEATGRALAQLPDEARPEILLCSPYVRARQTADLVRASAGLQIPSTRDERLRDRELGVLDRLTQAGVTARFPEEQARREWQGKFYHRPAGGESWADVVLRLRSWLAEVDQRHTGRRVLVVTHDIVIALVRYVCEGLDEEQVLSLARERPLRNAALSRYVQEPGGPWRVTAYDDVTHLEEAGLTVTHHEGSRHDGR
jgi:broad specificity phosphatase PhoE